MAKQKCSCTHEKQDHRVITANGRGACRICLCNAFQSESPRPARTIDKFAVADRSAIKPIVY